jgi:hypothetical protein
VATTQGTTEATGQYTLPSLIISKLAKVSSSKFQTASGIGAHQKVPQEKIDILLTDKINALTDILVLFHANHTLVLLKVIKKGRPFPIEGSRRQYGKRQIHI